MMKHVLVAFLLCLFLVGFATASPPTYDKLAKLPVIRFGEPVPDTDHILLFPAGQPVIISVSIEGSLFARSVNSELTVTPAREILVYREWASLDGLKWMPRSELIKSDVLVKVPGYNHPLPGILKVRMDLAETR
jgi:hypothetical protein